MSPRAASKRSKSQPKNPSRSTAKPAAPRVSSIRKTELLKYHKAMTDLIDRLETVIRGKRAVLEYLVTGMVAGGHILIEDVPGLGKTTLAKTLAHIISSSGRGKKIAFKRIQFTPDLLPYDITGVDIYNPGSRAFHFVKGPVFANIVLADEINRTTPKVQSALLEVMAENQVTVGNKTHQMDSLFFVIATQNPVETDGTYPLPISQIDRFLMKLKIGYPDHQIEVEIIKDDPAAKILPHVKPVCTKEELLKIREKCAKIFCDDRLIQAAVSLAAATRKHRGIELGASPRGSLMLIKAARAYAMMKARSYVIDQDLVDLAPLVIAHRLKLKDIRLDPEKLVREVTLAELSKLSY